MKPNKPPFPVWLRPLLFAAAGGLAGFLYYTFFGCRGSCPIVSRPVLTTLYVALIGWLLAGITNKET